MKVTAVIVVTLALTAPAVWAMSAPDSVEADADSGEWIETEWGYHRADLVLPERGDHPTVFIMEGYSGAGEPNAYLRMDDGVLIALEIEFGEGPDGAYAEVDASIRGTECSGGEYYLYDRRHAWDGHTIIEWVADQPWSNGNVGMIGWSYSGQTAYWTAATQPPSLKAVSANLLHSDIYRDIFMPGGVQNYAFPVVWAYGLGAVGGAHRVPVDSLEEGRFASDPICRDNQLTRVNSGSPPQPHHEPAWAAIGSTDNDWYQAHAATTHAPAITIPYYQQNNWHDEQTGPRAAVLWNFIHPDPVTIKMKDGDERTVVPKLMRTANGDHGWGHMASNEMWGFFDIFLRDAPDRLKLFENRVVNYFEITDDGSTYTATKSGDEWPFEDTTWTRFYAREDGRLTRDAPTGIETPDVYVSGEGRQDSWFFYTRDAGVRHTFHGDHPDAVAYESAPFAEDLVVAGPILMDLYASLSGTDSDFYVTLHDVHPDGSVQYVQRGILKASHRAISEDRSWYDADDGRLVQPYRPHTNPQPVTPGEVEHYAIEVFPVGHVFREGHQLLVRVHTPPVIDGLWGFTPTQHQPGVVTVHHDAEHPTSLQLPVVTPDAPIPEGPAPCPVPGAFPCVPVG